MNKRTLTSLMLLAAIAAAPGVAHAADPVVVPDAWATQMTALDGTVVWANGSQLMARAPDGTVAPVPGAPLVYYPDIDLGHDAQGRLVLTYLRCDAVNRCDPYRDDLAGQAVRIPNPAPRRCKLATSPSMWGSRMAYALRCSKLHGRPNVPDPKRSGMFVRGASGVTRRLPLPSYASTFPVDTAPLLDLRGTTIGAVVRNVDSYALAESVSGAHRHIAMVGDHTRGNQVVTGMSLDAAGVLWTVTNGSAGEGEDENPTDDVISRLGATRCADTERATPLGFVDHVAQTIAVDNGTMFLYGSPNVGIVRHVFTPTFTCP